MSLSRCHERRRVKIERSAVSGKIDGEMSAGPLISPSITPRSMCLALLTLVERWKCAALHTVPVQWLVRG